MWGGTLGAVLGPATLDPTASRATRLGLDDLAGAMLVAIVAFVLAGILCLVAMRPDPSTFVTVAHARSAGGEASIAVRRRIVVAVAALVVAQFVMLLILTITPLHVRGHDPGLSGVGLVISLHVFGMSGVLAASAPPDRLDVLAGALALLGLDWSAAFVASNALLTRTGPQLQGRADALGWGFAAVASLTSGELVAGVGYPVLSAVGAALAAVMVLVVVVELRREAAVRRSERV